MKFVGEVYGYRCGMCGWYTESPRLMADHVPLGRHAGTGPA